MENNGRFLENAELYPANVPKDFIVCPIKLGTIGIDPYVIMTEHYTQNVGSTEYKLTGLVVDVLEFVCEEMNLTTFFLPLSLNMEIDSYLKEMTKLE